MGSSVSCFGVRIGLRASAAPGLSALKSWLPRAVRPGTAAVVDALYSYVVGGDGPSAGTKRFHVLYRDATRLARSLDLDEVRRAFERDLSMAVGSGARRRIFIHAGVVSFDDGAVLIPGKSFSGKTTLVRALVDQGGAYYSDEFAVLDSRGRVFPWAEPLAIRRNGAMEAAQPLSPETLGLAIGRKSVPVRMVVLTSFEEGKRFRPKRMSPAAGALGLLEHTLPARARPRASMRALACAVSGAKVIRGSRGDARQAAQAIVKALEPRFVP